VMPIKFEVTDGKATLPKQFILEFGTPPPVVVKEVPKVVILSKADKKVIKLKEKEKKGLIDRSKYKMNFQAKATVGDMGSFAIGFTARAIVFGNGKLPGPEVLEVFYEKTGDTELKGVGAEKGRRLEEVVAPEAPFTWECIKFDAEGLGFKMAFKNLNEVS
jgi:hypothetical protein